MFTKIICFYVAVVCVCGAPPTDVVPLEKQQPTVIAIVSQSEELESNGTFKFSYETANGIKREETSYDKVLPKGKSSASSNEAGEDNNDESNEIHVQQGSYSYTAPDGSVITVRYIADENGFRPIGDHLPKAPALLVAATTRASKNKEGDNAKGGSEPAAAVVAAPAKDTTKPASEAPKKADSNEIEPRIADQSLEHVSTATSEDSSTISGEPSTTPGESSTANEESSTTTEIPSETAGKSTTTQAESSTTTEIPSTNPEEASTTQAESFTTTDIPATTTDQSSTTTKTPSTTAAVSSTPDVSSASEAASTEQVSPTNSDVTSYDVTSTEAVSTTEQASSKVTSSEETSSPPTSITNASPDSTPNSDATNDVNSTPI